MRAAVEFTSNLVCLVREIRLSALNARQVLELTIHGLRHVYSVHPKFLKDELRHVLCFLHHSLQYMYRLYDLL